MTKLKIESVPSIRFTKREAEIIDRSKPSEKLVKKQKKTKAISFLKNKKTD